MQPYFIAFLITWITANLMFGAALRARYPRRAAHLILALGLAGPYLYYPGNTRTLLYIGALGAGALLTRVLFRPYPRRRVIDPDAPLHPPIPVMVLVASFILALNGRAFANGIPLLQALVPITFLAALLYIGTKLLYRPVRDTLEQPDLKQHLLQNNVGVACYVLTLTTIVLFLAITDHDSLMRFLVALVVTLALQAYRVIQRNDKRRADDRGATESQEP